MDESKALGRQAKKLPFLKRFFDIVCASVGLVVLAPMLITIAVSIAVTMGSPIFFTQTRPGLHTRPFTIYKFRTMIDRYDASGEPLPDDVRLTRLGQFLRKTSLDELPELINVLKGDMSLVGPRPLLVRYLPFYTERERLRHTVRPGITGWAQIHGRNQIPWDERLALDVWYVEHQSFLLDLKILISTVSKVATNEGVVVATNTMETDLDHERQQKRQQTSLPKLG